MGNFCNHEHEEKIEEDIICCTYEEERKIFAKIYFRAGICHHRGFFHILNSRLFSSTRLVQKLICRTQISNGVDRLDPNTTRIKIMFISIAYFY